MKKNISLNILIFMILAIASIEIKPSSDPDFVLVNFDDPRNDRDDGTIETDKAIPEIESSNYDEDLLDDSSDLGAEKDPEAVSAVVSDSELPGDELPENQIVVEGELAVDGDDSPEEDQEDVIKANRIDLQVKIQQDIVLYNQNMIESERKLNELEDNAIDELKAKENKIQKNKSKRCNTIKLLEKDIKKRTTSIEKIMNMIASKSKKEFSKIENKVKKEAKKITPVLQTSLDA